MFISSFLNITGYFECEWFCQLNQNATDNCSFDFRILYTCMCFDQKLYERKKPNEQSIVAFWFNIKIKHHSYTK